MVNKILEVAKKYISGILGGKPFSIIPLRGKTPLTPHGHKDASKDIEQIEKWWNDNPAANIGIKTGEENDLIVIDVDCCAEKNKNGDESLKALEAELGSLPDTWKVTTGTGGSHLYFHYPVGHEIRNSASQIGTDIDIRGNGGYIVAPPSIHPDTGKEYTWVEGYSPEDLPLAELPTNWIERLDKKRNVKKKTKSSKSKQKEAQVQEDGSGRDVIPKGKRNESLFKYATSMRSKSVPASDIMEELLRYNEEKCNPPLEESEIERIFNSVMKYPEGQDADMILSNNSDTYNDEDLNRFHFLDKNNKPVGVIDYKIYADILQQENLFVLGGTLYLYKNGVYHADASGAEMKTRIKKRIFPKLIRSATIDRIYRLFFMEEDLCVDAEELNNYPKSWINFMNGFYDPVHKMMLPHDPKYYSVNQIPHEYHPERITVGDSIENWLKAIMSEDDREMLLQYAGYCMTIDTRQQKFLILCGAAGTGKSTLLQLIESVVGEENLNNISLKGLSQRFAAFGLMGKLLNSCADLEVSDLEDTSLVKKILGEDRIMGEAKGKDAISFRSYARLIFSTNEMPNVLNERTDGFFRRLMILEMNKIPENKSTDFVATLKKEISYFIYLCVSAVERMYEDGKIHESEKSKACVQIVKKDSDSVEAWIDECCDLDKNAKTERGILYNSYENYCDNAGIKAISRNQFYKDMRTKGFEDKSSSGKRYFEGISPDDIGIFQ